MDLRGFLATVVLAIVATAVAASSRLDIIDLPLGFSPEGITLAEKWTVYVGSFNTGVILSFSNNSLSNYTGGFSSRVCHVVGMCFTMLIWFYG